MSAHIIKCEEGGKSNMRISGKLEIVLFLQFHFLVYSASNKNEHVAFPNIYFDLEKG